MHFRVCLVFVIDIYADFVNLVVYCRAKNHQSVAMLLRTRLNNVVLPTLFKVVHNVVTPDSDSTILFNVVDNYEQCGQHNIVQSYYTAGS